MEAAAALSKMAVSNAHGEDSPYFAGWKAYEENPYHPVENPTGVIQMGLAENQVSFDLVEKYLEQNPGASTWGATGPASFRENAFFQDYHGLYAFRKAMASFMEKIRGGRVKFDPDRIVLTAGSTAANELLAFILADPGDALLLPTPYYPGFDRDLQWRTGVTIVPVHCRSTDSFQLTLQSLAAAYSAATASNLKVKALLITNPSNPLGVSSPRSLLEAILDFAAEKNIHLISDEIYSGSVFSDADFVSVAEIAGSRADRVHIVYSLSKDLGLPGFRAGALYSYNDGVVKAARRMSSFSLVSSQTQRMLAGMLSDEEFAARYIETNRRRLRERYEMVVEGMKEAGIECLKGNAGLFCWVNLGEFIEEEEKTTEGELRLWKVVVEELKLNISPGFSCRCSEPGWFRVCFANLSGDELEVAMRRLTEFAANFRARTDVSKTNDM